MTTNDHLTEFPEHVVDIQGTKWHQMQLIQLTYNWLAYLFAKSGACHRFGQIFDLFLLARYSSGEDQNLDEYSSSPIRGNEVGVIPRRRVLLDDQ